MKNTEQNFFKRIRAVAIVVHNQRVLLMHRIKNGKEYYVFPGGGVEEGETVEQAVLREVKEETSLEVKIGKFLYHHIYNDDTEQFFYLCRYISGIPRLSPESNEAFVMKNGTNNFYEPLWYDIKNLSGLLLYPPEIKDWFLEDIKLSKLRHIL